jgi:hypothetical protein
MGAVHRWQLIIEQIKAAQLEMAYRKLYEVGKSRP